MINYTCLSAGHFLCLQSLSAPPLPMGQDQALDTAASFPSVEVINSLFWSLTVFCLYLMPYFSNLKKKKKKLWEKVCFMQLHASPNAGLSWWSSGWQFAYQYRGHRFNPWFGKILHATGQLSLCATTYWSPLTLEPWSATREATTIRSLHIAMQTQSSQK